MKYGGILKACRERSGMNQEELAFQLHVSQSDISKYETNVREPSITLFNQWIQQTQTQEVMVAFLCGVDGIGAMQQIIETMSGTVGAVINNIMYLL